MKKLNYLLASIFLLTSMVASAQVDIKIEPCVQAKDAMTKQEKKELVKGIKGKKELPKDLFTEKVIVFILDNKTANISNIINRKNKEGNYSFNETIKEAKEACKNAGLNVVTYIIDEMQDDLTGKKIISATVPPEDLEMVEKSKVKYYLMISDNIGVNSSSMEFNGLVSNEKEGVYAKIIDVEKPLNFSTISLKELTKEGRSSTYKEGKTINRIAKGAIYGGKYELPVGLKISKIYFVNNPNLILPKSKPKGLMCKISHNYFESMKEENLEQNTITEKQLKKCKINSEIVDKESEVKPEENSYILKYYEYTYTIDADVDRNGIPDTKKIETFYLENTITKKVYAFKSGTVSNKYDKYLEKVIKEINEH